MRRLLLLSLLAVAAPHYLDYEVVQWDGAGLEATNNVCCKANALNLCSGTPDTACDDSGTCYCCPNGGGITANFTDGVQCSCGYRQTCTDTKCKGKTCGDHGVCVNGVCVCDYGWSGAACTTDLRCCETPYDADNATLCQSTNPLIAGVCKGDTCFCCPYLPTAAPNRASFNVDGLCKCTFHVPKCADPGLPPCTYVTCGEHATCSPSTGICRCDKGWTGLQPATNSCLTEACSPACGIHGTCVNYTCSCDDGFYGETCKSYQGSAAPAPADHTVYSNSTPKSVYILYSAVIVPALVLFLASLATLTNRIWAETQGSSAGRADARSSLLPTAGPPLATAETKGLIAGQYSSLHDGE